jgi:(+)-trans-carveol dehydrogenase
MRADHDLRGRVALITGAARGVGKDIALGLAEAGAHIVLVDRCLPATTTLYSMASDGELDAAVREIELVGVRCMSAHVDVTDLPGMDALMANVVSAFGHLDIVVANAGILSWGKLWDLSEAQWDEMIDVNLKGTWITLKTAVPYMIARRRGRIICVSSTAGLRGWEDISHYVASKHGVIGLVRSLAREVGEYGVTVNAVCPTFMKTPMVLHPAYYQAFAGGGASESDMDQQARTEHVLPVDSLPTEAVRDAVGWLASDAAQYITGVALPVDAGEMLV